MMAAKSLSPVKWPSSEILHKYFGLPYIDRHLAALSTKWLSRYPSYLRLVFLKQGHRWLQITNSRTGAGQSLENHLNLALQVTWPGKLEQKSTFLPSFLRPERNTPSATSSLINRYIIRPNAINSGMRPSLSTPHPGQTDPIKRNDGINSNHRIHPYSDGPFRPEAFHHVESLFQTRPLLHPSFYNNVKYFNQFFEARNIRKTISLNPLARAAPFFPAKIPAAKGRLMVSHPESRSPQLPTNMLPTNCAVWMGMIHIGEIKSFLLSSSEPNTMAAANADARGSGLMVLPQFFRKAWVHQTGETFRPQGIGNLLMPLGATTVAAKEAPSRVVPSVIKAATENLHESTQSLDHRRNFAGERFTGQGFPNDIVLHRKIAGSSMSEIKLMNPLLNSLHYYPKSSENVTDHSVFRAALPRIMRTISIPAMNEMTITGQRPFLAGDPPLLFADALSKSSERRSITKSPASSVIEHAYPLKAKVQSAIVEERSIPESPASAKPPIIDMGKVADQVFFLLEKKIKIERERRGLHA
ncbi:MAG: hypothetical protein EHM14_01405 [Methanothrix sp.]|nr:MAG: hypothetical protein EHM14_01405 [Methanothrix sp.]